MDRAKHLALADAAVCRAERIAGHAESAAHADDPNRRHKVAAFTAVAAAWADIARTHTALAEALPESETETTDA
jgi:hypothetical protein